MLIYELLFYFLHHYCLKLLPTIYFSVSTLSAVSGSVEVAKQTELWFEREWEEPHHTVWDWKVQMSILFPVALFAPCLQVGCKLSAPAPAPCRLAYYHASWYDDHGL